MGYDLHITRAEDWTESEQNPISWDEWFQIVEEDPELIIDPENGLPDVVWIGHPSKIVGTPLWYQNGEIFTKNPDLHTHVKVMKIAKMLSAVVVGDNGETYSYDGTLLSVNELWGINVGDAKAIDIGSELYNKIHS